MLTIHIRLRGALLLALACGLCRCQLLPAVDIELREEILSSADALFSSRPAIPEPHDIHVLSLENQAEFLRYFNDPVRAHIPDYRRLANYLDLIIRDFDYRTDTFDAQQTISGKSGNCLSLAVMTTALARLAEVETAYQLMDSDPVFNFHDTLVEKGVHVRTLLLNSKRSIEAGETFESPGIAIDFFPTGRERFVRNMLEGEYEAMYYRNIANEALRLNDLSKAYWFARESLRFDPRSSEALNTLAIVNRRAGNSEVAESIYLFALDHADEKLTLLKNYRALLLSSGRDEEAMKIDARLQGMTDPSPFHWYQLAQSAFEDHDYRRAVDYYSRALSLAPYLHEAHLGLAKSYFELGYSDRSLQSLVAAIENAGSIHDRRYYKAKLPSFQPTD